MSLWINNEDLGISSTKISREFKVEFRKCSGNIPKEFVNAKADLAGIWE